MEGIIRIVGKNLSILGSSLIRTSSAFTAHVMFLSRVLLKSYCDVVARSH